MPARRWDLTVEQGSYEPQYIVLRDPDTNQPLDLTASGFSVHGVIATRPDQYGQVLADLPDNTVWRRTSGGRLYFEPLPAVTSGWAFRLGWHQIELTHPATGHPVRVAEGRVRVSPEIVIP